MEIQNIDQQIRKAAHLSRLKSVSEEKNRDVMAPQFYVVKKNKNNGMEPPPR